MVRCCCAFDALEQVVLEISDGLLLDIDRPSTLWVADGRPRYLLFNFVQFSRHLTRRPNRLMRSPYQLVRLRELLLLQLRR